MLDRRKVWKSAERMLKQGNVQAALAELKKVSEKSEGDVVVLNRLADLLAQQGRAAEAIGYYDKIAARFEEGGFVPKAIAIHTKILRLEPGWNSSLIKLGELYSRQNLHGEARKFLLHAANTFLKENNLGKAREVFEKLVEGEPGNFRHSLRLAETVAAMGDTDQAIELLLHAGYQALDSDEAQDATKVFARAVELGCGTVRLSIGAARCHEVLGDRQQAQRLLESSVNREGGAGATVELARLHLVGGETSRSMKLLESVTAACGEISQWVRVMKAALERNATETTWIEFDGAIDRAGGFAESRVLRLLEALSEVEEQGGHVPALKRLADAYQSRGELNRAVPAIDALVRACREQSLDKEAEKALERMRAVVPADEEPRVDSRDEPVLIEPTSHSEPSSSPESASSLAEIDMSSMAVPIDAADEEFCAGRLTQAEVLEKYDLSSQALEQLDEILARFPGHVEAHSQRVIFLRDLGSTGDVAQGLSQLAMAQLSAGDSASARSAAEEALASKALPQAAQAKLIELDLIDGDDASPARLAPAALEPTVAAIPVAPIESVGPTADEDTAQSRSVLERAFTETDSSGGDDVLIDLDMDLDEGGVSTPSTAAASGGIPAPSAEQLEEVQESLRAGRLDDACAQLDALCEQGHAGPEMGRLRRDLEEARAQVAVVAPAQEADDSHDADAHLQAIHAALEGEMLGDVDMQPIVPEEPDEDVTQILEAFKQRVAEEVSADDHRTHYDLGIGFKGMGLLDEAISEFQCALDGPELHVESSTMLALCHCDRQEWGEAEKWYRSAVSGAQRDGESARLRYDLAEVLLMAGNVEGALREFRDLMDFSPNYRDVETRVGALETQLQS